MPYLCDTFKGPVYSECMCELHVPATLQVSMMKNNLWFDLIHMLFVLCTST